MAEKLLNLIEGNRRWATSKLTTRPDFFETLSKQQTPQYLWIGCSDSRVPANEVVGLEPGEMFVHRNVANVVTHTDLNCLSVVQYAVEALKVSDIIVCGHYGCGGVAAALQGKPLGLIDNWLRHVKDVHHQHRKEFTDLNYEAQCNRLCELNVSQQVANLCYTTIVQEAWARGQALSVHGWVYGLVDGLVRDLNLSISATDQLPSIYQMG